MAEALPRKTKARGCGDDCECEIPGAKSSLAYGTRGGVVMRMMWLSMLRDIKLWSSVLSDTRGLESMEPFQGMQMTLMNQGQKEKSKESGQADD